MANGRVTFRNFLVICGSYYLVAWATALFWMPLIRVVTGRDYLGMAGAVGMQLLDMIPSFLAACLGGLAAGVTLDSRRVSLWAAAFGLIVGTSSWLSWKWHIAPGLTDRAMQAAFALVPGVVGFVSVVIGSRWAQRRLRVGMSPGA